LERNKMLRSHDAGSLNAKSVGTKVVLAGWVARRRDHGGVAFIDLRDSTGAVQVVINDEKIAGELRAEWCVLITGNVKMRPAGNENKEIPTGEIEVVCEQLQVLSEAAALPFPVDSGDMGNISEEVRLKYRYLDLRREGPARNLRLRSKVSTTIRKVLSESNFLEIETPYLTRSTPEGARDFLVPVRLDIEISFADQSDVISIAEKVLSVVFQDVVNYKIPLPIPHMTYRDAMADYGSDKPDLRFANKITDVTQFFKATAFRVFQAEYVGAVVMPGGADSPRRELDAWQDWAKARGAKGLAYILVGADGTLSGPVAKNLSETESAGIAAKVGAKNGDAIFFAAGNANSSQSLLGAVRVEIGARCNLIDEKLWSFVWIVDAPMFEQVDAENPAAGWTAVHHPFTSPKPEFVETFDKEPAQALAYAYDIVLNGNEIGGGSIRIHQSDIQQRVFKTIGLSKAEAESKFGFLLEAFNYGPPPHGGIALGLDRLCALLVGAQSIREVIAFPKTASGGDPLTGAPTPITPAQRKETGVDTPAVTK